jgi:hypothetical protein
LTHVAVVALVLAAAAPDPPMCPASDGVSRYCTRLTIRDGATVREPSVLTPASGNYPAGSKEALDAFLDEALKKLEKPYRLTLTEKEQAEDDAGTLPDVDGLLSAMRHFDGSIRDYFGRLDAWCTKRGACLNAPDVILTDAGLYRVLSRLQDAPLLYSSDSDVFNPENGLVTFRVPPPLDLQPNDIRISNLAQPAAARRVRQLLDRLDDLRGSLWRRAVVIARIRDFYDELGLDPDTRVSFDLPRPSISILEGTTIRGIAFPFGLPANRKTASADPDWAKVDKSLYAVLSDRQFRDGYLARKTAVRSKLASSPAPVLSFADDLGVQPNAAPLVNRLRLPIQQLLLQQNGFALSVTQAMREVVDGNELSFAYWRLEDLQDEPAKPGSVPTAPAPADTLGRVDPHGAELSPRPSFADRPPVRDDAAPAYCDIPRLGEKNTFLGGGGEYRPGQGVRWFGLAQRSNLRVPFGDMSLAAQAGQGGAGTPLATGSIAFDYLFFQRLHRRLAVVANSGVDSSPNRVLGGQPLDERRTGGTLRVELEVFRDHGGHLLKVFGEGRRQEVALSRADVDIRKAQLNTVDLGASHLYQSADTPYPWTLRLEPLLRVALATDDVPSFTRGSITARFHRVLPAGFAAEVGGQLAGATGHTPDFELWSIGGSDSVRGFRRDDGLGRRAWWTQSEIWTPLPFAKADFLRKSVKLAGFVDVGGASSGGDEANSGARRGVGPGVRMLYGPVVFRADWAHGWGAAATGSSRNHFYFTVSTNLPF